MLESHSSCYEIETLVSLEEYIGSFYRVKQYILGIIGKKLMYSSDLVLGH